MGLLYYAITIPSAFTTAFILNIFTNARFIFVGALTHLRLYKPPPDDQQQPNPTDSILILDHSSPSLIPVPVQLITAAIKNRVPTVLFRDYYTLEKGSSGELNVLCSICLDCIQSVDYVRDLYNCTHLFHTECLDNWVDEGQVTCPLCRSMLLPPKINPLFLR
ncbi:hypothetical protein CASFOL_000065 [Castilleja foliolosa]|uniref:RING-type domain-containing protein n=1 Tax=Castilleja foliolosa TaxID=1961234 RepID=A0ABD3ERH9_9LAMI